MNNNKYYNKYLKYKNKYFLNKLKGGSDDIIEYYNTFLETFGDTWNDEPNDEIMINYLIYFYKQIGIQFNNDFLNRYVTCYILWYNNRESLFYNEGNPYRNYLPIIFITPRMLNEFQRFLTVIDDEVIDYQINFIFNDYTFTYRYSRPSMIWWFNRPVIISTYKCWFKILDDDFRHPFLYFIILNYVAELINKITVNNDNLINKIESIKFFQNTSPYNIIIYFNNNDNYRYIYDIICIIFELFNNVEKIHIGHSNIARSPKLYTFKKDNKNLNDFISNLPSAGR